MAERPRQLREWNRDLESRKIAGVCAGLAEALGISVTAVRAAFVLLALPWFSGMGVALYLVLWFLMPAEPDGESGLDRVVDAVASLVGEAPHRARREHSSRREIEDPDEL